MKTILKSMVALSLVGSALFGADIENTEKQVDCEAYLKKEGIPSNINIKETCEFFNKKFEKNKKHYNSTLEIYKYYLKDELDYNKLMKDDSDDYYPFYSEEGRKFYDIGILSEYNLISKEEEKKFMLSDCNYTLKRLFKRIKETNKNPKEICDTWYKQKLTPYEKMGILADYSYIINSNLIPSKAKKEEIISIFGEDPDKGGDNLEQDYKRLKNLGLVK